MRCRTACRACPARTSGHRSPSGTGRRTLCLRRLARARRYTVPTVGSPRRSALHAAGQQLLALLGAPTARLLRTAEEIRELGVPVALGVLPVRLESQHVAQALLGEPDDVVVLVLRAGDVAGLARHRCLPGLVDA